MSHGRQRQLGPSTLALCAALSVAACGGSAPEPMAPEASADTTNEMAAPAAPAENLGETAATADPDEPPHAADSEDRAYSSADGPADSGGPEQPREVLYKMTSGGLVIEVDGVRFEPSAEPVRKKGGWGVRLTVKATSTDDRVHRLLSPDDGPLGFFAVVDRGGKTERIGDERSGDSEVFVTPGDSIEFSREFPGKGAPLWQNQKLELQVGLWGLGADAERARPIKKFLVVKMATGRATPQPIITPPE